MAARIQDVIVIGVHKVEASASLIEDTLELQYGGSLSGAPLREAQESVLEHFEGLYLFEVQVRPPSAKIDWSQFTQPVPGVDRSSWQVAYDERLIDAESGRWAFYFHFLDLKRPLATPAGDRELPEPSSIPRHLAGIEYEAPG